MKQLIILFISILLCSCTSDFEYNYNIESQIYIQQTNVSLDEYHGITQSFLENGNGFTILTIYGMEIIEPFNYQIENNIITIKYKNDIEYAEIISSCELIVYTRNLKIIHFYRYDNK